MLNLNRVIITGYLGKDPETVKAGETTATHFSVAVTSRWKNSAGDKQERTNWLPIVMWNGRGENAAKYLKTGSHVLVEGSLRVSQWDDDETGQKRWKTEIVADQVIFLSKKETPKRSRRQPELVKD